MQPTPSKSYLSMAADVSARTWHTGTKGRDTLRGMRHAQKRGGDATTRGMYAHHAHRLREVDGPEILSDGTRDFVELPRRRLRPVNRGSDV